MKNIFNKIPLLFTLFLFCVFLIFLLQDKNPAHPPSALLNKEIPRFQAEDLIKNNFIIDEKILYGKKTLINFFASWCSPCKVEHPMLIEISERHSDILLIGINHKDKKSDALNFLKIGNPYEHIAVDSEGSIAMNFGVFGLPETFITNEKGKIIFSHIGPITEKIYNEKIKNLL